MFPGINKYLASRKCRIFRNLAFCKFFDLEGQDIWYLDDFARLEMFPFLSGIELLNIRFSGMKTLGDEFEQRRVREPFQSCLLGMTAGNVADQFQVFLSNCVGG